MISAEEKVQFRMHARNYADVESYRSNPYNDDADEILRFWEDSKQQYLYRLLGEEVILSRKVTYNQEDDALREEMEIMMRNHQVFTQLLLNRLETAIKPKWEGLFGEYPQNKAAEFYDVVRSMLSTSNLIEGRVPANASCVVIGKEIQLTYGQKSMRALGRLATLLNLTEEFEDFRIAHSQVLNQRTITGILHLSIHPLDYATASDNNNDWSSCMSWEDGGCYRLGTVEMMNSPMVLCAYLTGSNVMHNVGGKDWNSKKWRAWVIVNKDVILVNRQYPYDNTSISTTIVNWVKELAEMNLGWKYKATESPLDYTSYGFRFRTNFMYNDVCGDHAGAIGEHVKRPDHDSYCTTLVNFSGPANCMWCGAEIRYNDNQEEANTLCCPTCRDGYVCCCCGQHLSEDDVNWGLDDQPYCCDCYNETYTSCDHCDNCIRIEDSLFLDLGIDEELLGKLVRASGTESSAYKKYRVWWGTAYDDRLSLPEHFGENICVDCLRNHFGIDPSNDLLFDVAMPYNHYKSYWGGGYTTVCTINPAKVSFEQANQLFGFFWDKEDADGSLDAIWRQMWSDFIARMVKQGSIEI